MTPAIVPIDRRAVALRGVRLEYFTIVWNTLEGIIALTAGGLAGSVALVGFGFDSGIEVLSGVALLWRMSVDADDARRERNERVALRVVGACFVVLAAYVAYGAVGDLIAHRAPAHSVTGIVLAAVSLIVMPVLARAKKRIGTELHSAAMHADAKQTEFCMYLSAILLAGLVLNSVANLWWADPLAALVMVPIITIEGLKGLRGDPCCG
jgi:divalent metal cation (Fe/Co/Zn/Cd) transporter